MFDFRAFDEVASLQESSLLISEADVSWGRGNLGGGVRSWAVFGFVGTCLIIANVLQKVVSNLILNGLVINVVDSNPWHPLVRWGERIGLDSDLMLHGDGITSLVAGHDIVKVG